MSQMLLKFKWFMNHFDFESIEALKIECLRIYQFWGSSWNDVSLSYVQCSTTYRHGPNAIKFGVWPYFGRISRLCFLFSDNLKIGVASIKKKHKIKILLKPALTILNKICLVVVHNNQNKTHFSLSQIISVVICR